MTEKNAGERRRFSWAISAYLVFDAPDVPALPVVDDEDKPLAEPVLLPVPDTLLPELPVVGPLVLRPLLDPLVPPVPVDDPPCWPGDVVLPLEPCCEPVRPRRQVLNSSENFW
jgi:hypothetical protein